MRRWNLAWHALHDALAQHDVANPSEGAVNRRDLEAGGKLDRASVVALRREVIARMIKPTLLAMAVRVAGEPQACGALGRQSLRV